MERFQQKRSHGRDKYYQPSSTKVKNHSDPSSAPNVIFTGRTPAGNAQFRKHVDASEVLSDTGSCSSGQTEEDSFAYELRPGSSKQAGGTLIKKLLAEELSKEMESRRRPPSVIARLMGLDALPPQQPIQKQQKKFSENYLKRTASIGFVEKNSSHEGRSFRMNKKEPQEFKDVFEVLESSHAGKQGNPSAPKETVNSKVSESKMEFIRQKFMDVKRLSTDEKLQHSKEFHDALEVLDSNKDLLLKFLQEPDSLFTKHLHDLQGVPPPPPAGHITVLKSSNAHKYENGDIGWKSERKEWKDVTDSCQKPEHGVVCRPQNKHNVHISSKVSKTRFERKNEASLLPTRIVVLKPNVGTVQNAARTLPFPNSSEVLQSDHRKHREYRSSENQELFAEMRDQRISSREVELLKHRTQGSREIAKEITRQMRNSARSSSSTKALSSRLGGYVGDESSYTISVNDSTDESEVMKWKSRYSPSTSYSTESSVSREAKKRISERLKMTNCFQKVGTVGRGNTLGEMLAMPDRETRPTNLESMVGQEGYTDRLAWNDGVAKWGSPLGISSRDGWKDECARTLPRSRSLPASSTFFGSPRKVIRDGAFGSDRCSVLKETVTRGSNKSKKADSDHREGLFSKSNIRSSSKKSNSFLHVGRENNPTVQESHLKPDEPRKIIEDKDLLEKTPISLAQSDGGLDVTIPVNDEIAFVLPEDAEMSSGTPETPEPIACISTWKEENFSACDPDGPVPEKLSTEEAPEESLHTSSHCLATEPESPRSSKEAEQPSPVSVLEPPFVDEVSPDSDCFESVSADLQGLRMQLQLLKLESSDAYSEDIEMIVSSDEDTAEEGSLSFLEKGELIGRLRDENSRDFSYLIDVLVDSEFLDAERDMPLATWYSPDCPVGLPVFEKLEKQKYGEQTNWPRSERRLLFDRINAGLMEILQQDEDPHPWIKPVRTVRRGWREEPLEEELWNVLVREGKEGREEDALEKGMVLGKEIRWLDLGNEIDVVGREIERWLMDELVAEVLSM
ncbi:Protein of unknown function DUF3741 [Macleaya cordata]|uniref:DUF4378 domain-containing protein n=1 Tax=Macleaya cordata TaxID=56857 RepID=A0A200R6E6_MACCD|nr:Protein of unknown function DUF3741 [Macleaya cordata]